ncbi:hypothetical protein JTE90_013262 [Oedothorax gibbosus]|uniref:Uncharacterized protein n=1 Tax=Oedothorax gibbosus TaxID=931172 RepID=A0AAV6VF19_9ARAC|nr:hypothetical protein JTE90_013262 [Oedothorax gibbosus]
MALTRKLAFKIDFICSASFIRYQQEWVPIQMVFAAINDSKNVKVIAPKPDSMISFTMENILINENLPDQPWYAISQEDGTQHTVIVTEMKDFISAELYQAHLTHEDLWPAHIGTLDMNTYHYLLPLLPIGHVHFLGMKILPEETLFGPQKKIGLLARKAANILHIEREISKWNKGPEEDSEFLNF